MTDNDPILHTIVTDHFGTSPFRRLPMELLIEDVQSPQNLREAFIRMFTHADAAAARNIVFIWTVQRPFQHTAGKGLPSTVSYIEITKRSMKNRWPATHIGKLCANSARGQEVPPTTPLRQLARKGTNLTYYSRLVSEHGPLQIHYASLDRMNEAARLAGKPQKPSIREWERSLIHAYRQAHGVRPLKNVRG